MTIPRSETEQFENAVLGAVLNDPNIIDNVIRKLKPEDFYSTRNKKLFSVLTDMHRDLVPIDLMTVFEYARKQNADHAIGGAQRLIYLTESTPAPANYAYYVQTVKEASARRELITTLTAIRDELSADKLSVPEAWAVITEIESSSPGSSALTFISAEDITPESESVQSLWGEVLYPECITQINSEPGVGKTTFVYNLCVQAACGGQFLGIAFSKRLKVLYIDVETPKWKRAIKLATITGGDRPKGLYFLETLDMHSQYADLLSLSKDESFDLIVFDTQSRIFNLENENDNSDANRMMNALRRLVSECGCSAVLVHHTSKSEKKGVYSGRGASAIGGAVDVVVNMEALDPESIKLKVDKNRISGDYMTLFIRKTGDEKFEQFIPEGQTLSGFEKFKVQEFIMSLAEKKTVWASSEIVYLCSEQGFTERTTRRAISNLTQSGRLTKISRGEYEISN